MPDLHSTLWKNSDKKIKEIGNLKYLYRNELDKACSTHDAAYSDILGLAKRTISDKILKNRNYIIAKNLKFDGYQRALASMVYKFLIKIQDQEWI